MTDIVKRLRDAHPFSPQYALGSMILAEAADEIETLRTDNATLREALQHHMAEAAKLIQQRDHIHAIVCACLSALNNGSGATPKCSIEFLTNAPTEIGLVVSGVKQQRDDLLAALKVERDWEYNGFEPDNQSSRWHKLCAIIVKVEAANA